jgi:cytochrome c oxidase subunit 2
LEVFFLIERSVFVGRFWSLLFLMVPIFGVGTFVWAMAGWWPMQGHWLPENVNAHGGVIDSLFLFILVLTGIIFIATTLVMFWFLWRYDAEKNSAPVAYTHGSHTLEVVWSIIPAATLVFIAIYQMDAWADAKMRRPRLPNGEIKPPIAEITGRQFEWRIRYAGEDGVVGTPDDIQLVNDLHLPVNEEIVLIKRDVLAAFPAEPPHQAGRGARMSSTFGFSRRAGVLISCVPNSAAGSLQDAAASIEFRDKFDAWLAQSYGEQNQAAFTPASEEAGDQAADSENEILKFETERCNRPSAHDAHASTR